MRGVSRVASSRLPSSRHSLSFSRGASAFLGAASSCSGERARLHLGQAVAVAPACQSCIRSVSRIGVLSLVEAGRSGELARLRA